MSGRWKGVDRHGAEVIEADDAVGGHAVLNAGDLHQRNLGASRLRVDVEVLNVGEPRALVHLQTRDDGNVLVAILQRGHGHAAHGAGGGIGHVHVADAGQVGAIGIDDQADLGAFGVPLVAHAHGCGSGLQDVDDLRGDMPHGLDILRAARSSHVGIADDANLDRIVHRVGLQLAEVDPHAGHGRREHRLHLVDKVRRDVLVVQLNQHFGVVELLRLRRQREPEARTAAADPGRHIAQDMRRIAALVGMLLAPHVGLLADDLLDLLRRLVGGLKGRVVGQPDVGVGPILDVVREERGPQLGEEKSTQQQERQRADGDLPAMLDGELGNPRIVAGEARGAAHLDRLLRASCRDAGGSSRAAE